MFLIFERGSGGFTGGLRSVLIINCQILYLTKIYYADKLSRLH